MQQQVSLKLLPSEAAAADVVTSLAAAAAGLPPAAVTGYRVLRKSIDARGRQTFVNLTLTVFCNEPFIHTPPHAIQYNPVPASAAEVVVVGAGPAGLFAALRLIELGLKPIVLERGKDVRSRRRDLAALNKQGMINPESNYCFGEGGAGTYSDGKLYTRSNKRGDINRILNLFVQFGADEAITYTAHPHIGTNKLPHIITAMRQAIVQLGGVFVFEEKVTGFEMHNHRVTGVHTAKGSKYHAAAVVLATGHSARDVFTLLHHQQVAIEAKPFALGVRVEHPQALIDSIQYSCNYHHNHQLQRDPFLPPASYSLVGQVGQRGVFSFCMCPGGIIAPASTGPGELVVNGWSPSKRNNPYANSGMVVSCDVADLAQLPGFTAYLKSRQASLQSPLALMYFQQWVEEKAYQAGGGGFVAPAQRLVDFAQGTTSATLPGCSYVPGTSSVHLGQVLPAFIHSRLQQGFKAFGRKMRGYFTNEAVVLATESRTSSPVRIPRLPHTLQHPQVQGLYPCGEGAGYAGGIVSAAMDGERVADAVAVQVLGHRP